MFQREEKQSLQAHLHLATFTSEVYEVIKEVLKENKVRSSTFNALRNLSSDEKTQCIKDFKKSGFNKAILQKKAKVAKANKPTRKEKEKVFSSVYSLVFFMRIKLYNVMLSCNTKCICHNLLRNLPLKWT